MITVFNRASIYIGRDMKRFSEIREQLTAKNIEYTYKVKNQMGEWSGHGTVRGRTGSLGQDSELQYEYEIFVKKEDAEKAGHIIKK